MSLLRIARNVQNLGAAARFYEALGFETASGAQPAPELASCLGVARVEKLLLRLGAQTLELTQCHPQGAPYPPHHASNDVIFQHLALVTTNIAAAAARALAAGAQAISLGGPVLLPKSSGGMRAFKFRDPDGHPLEFLEFQNHPPGYDHSAISVSNAARSIEFYAALGFAQTARQTNAGPEQENLDALQNVAVDVVTLKATAAAPHLELLAYQNPIGRAGTTELNDIAADRLVLSVPGPGLAIRRDPDGHTILLEGPL